jgi:predicted dienelactone hydrolase
MSRIASDAKGPRIGALGHSAGGYTVLALAGGVPDLSRIASHCRIQGDDPIFCSMGRSGRESKSLAAPSAELADSRVRAVAALAPVGVVFSAASLATIRIPTTIYAGDKDSFLVPRYHALWVKQNISQADFHLVPNAGHFAFMDTPKWPIQSEDGDIGANPAGFDRTEFLKQFAIELIQFFDRTLQ